MSRGVSPLDRVPDRVGTPLVEVSDSLLYVSVVGGTRAVGLELVCFTRLSALTTFLSKATPVRDENKENPTKET